MSIQCCATNEYSSIPHLNAYNSVKKVVASIIVSFSLGSSSGLCYDCNKPVIEPVFPVVTEKTPFNVLSQGEISVFSTSENYRRIQDSIKRISEISALPNNWDGDGAAAFSSSIIDFVKKLIFTLSVQPDIFPTLRNSIQLEYENVKNEYLEFEVFEDHIKSFFYDHKDRSIVKEIRAEEVNAIVNDFYE